MNNVLGSNWHSENLAFVDADPTYNNMTAVLYQANNTVYSMLGADADSNWGHRDNFLDPLALNAAFGFRKLDNGYYVMTFDTTYANNADKANDLIANTINNYAAMGPTTGSTTTTPVDHSAEIAQLQSKLADLNNTLATQQAKVNDLQNKLNDLNSQKSAIESDQASKLADAKTQHDNKIADLNRQITDKQAQKTQLENDIKGLQEAIAKDQTKLDQLNQGGQTPTDPDHGSTTNPDHGGTTTPTNPDHGNTTNPSDQGQTTNPDDHQGTQPSDQGQTTPVAPAHRDDSQSTPSQPASQLPAGYKVVNNQVVDANGSVVNNWKVVNGQAVPATREAYKAQQAQAKQLPQTGNANIGALMGLGLASFASMLGLSVVNKKRN